VVAGGGDWKSASLRKRSENIKGTRPPHSRGKGNSRNRKGGGVGTSVKEKFFR